jgi:sugar lactone lactonase YvrE
MNASTPRSIWPRVALLLTIMPPFDLAAQPIIQTIAGCGLVGYAGDGGPALDARFNMPHGLACDSAGNIYIADAYNHRIRKVDIATGIISTFAGNGVRGFGGDGGPATAASFYRPYGLAFDTAGNLFIADTDNNRIRRVDAVTGIITTVAGNGNRGFSGDGGPALNAMFKGAYSLAVDAAGNLFITDTSNNRIRRVDVTTGIISTYAGNGTYGYSGDGGPATAAKISNIGRATFDPAGNLHIVDRANHRIRKVDAATGIITTVVGTGLASYCGDGGPATAACIHWCEDAVIDSAGNIFLADSRNERVRMVDGATGIINTVAGTGVAGFSGDGGPAIAAQLSGPFQVALDPAGNLCINTSYRVRVVYGIAVMTDIEPPTVDARIGGAESGDLNEGASGSLNGCPPLSHDNRTTDSALAYLWTQTAGPSGAISDPGACDPVFTAPLLPGGAPGHELVTLLLEVVDEAGNVGSDTLELRVWNVNHPPLPDAGADQTVDEGASVSLNGSASGDPDGDAISFQWTQISGPEVINPQGLDTATPSLTAPLVSPGGATLEFQLCVTDGFSSPVCSTVRIDVVNIGNPPDCSAAVPSISELWPPNFRLVRVTIEGVDDGNLPTMIRIDRVMQDEPVVGLLAGFVSPDAICLGNAVRLRAERASLQWQDTRPHIVPGNGRVYHVHFTATNAQGSCPGMVTVDVPHDQSPGSVCIDDTLEIDSTAGAGCP